MGSCCISGGERVCRTDRRFNKITELDPLLAWGKQVRSPIGLAQEAKWNNFVWFSFCSCRAQLSEWNGAFRELYLCYIPRSKIEHKTHLYPFRYGTWNRAIPCSKTTSKPNVGCCIATWEKFKCCSVSCYPFSQRLLSLQTAVRPWEGHLHVQVCYNYHTILI